MEFDQFKTETITFSYRFNVLISNLSTQLLLRLSKLSKLHIYLKTVLNTQGQ